MSDVFVAAKVVVQAVLEHNAKIKQTNEITARIQKGINQLADEIKEYMLQHSLEQFRGHIEWYKKDFSDTLDRYIEERISKAEAQATLTALISKIGLERNAIDFQSRDNPDFYSKQVHPILVSAVTLQIATYSELSARFNDYTGDEYIIRELEYILKKHHQFFMYQYDKSYNRHNRRHFNNPLSNFAKYKSIVKYRKFLEYSRYRHLINLNGHFQFIDPSERAIFGNFRFNRCAHHEIKEADNGRRVLAVNNKDGQIQNPSILKDVYDISAKSDITFDVTLKSTIPNRTIEIVIWEIRNNGVNVSKATNPCIINENWETKSVQYKKLRDDTRLRFEIYWQDNQENDLFIKNTYINFTQVQNPIPDVKFKDKLPFPDYVGWGHRSHNKEVFLKLNDDYLSSLYLAANDVRQTHRSPSMYYDLFIMWSSDWARLNVTFEVFLKTRRDIGRTVKLCIHELYPLGGGNNEIKNSAWSEKYRLSTEWQKCSITCEREKHTNVRLEIYWKDNDSTDIMMRDAKAIYTIK